MRILLSAAVLLGLSACAVSTLIAPPAGRLTLSNFRFERASIETIVAAGPDCTASVAPPAGFDLPFKGLRVIEATPGADVCWRRLTAPGRWTEWNRAYTASGRSIDSQI